LLHSQATFSPLVPMSFPKGKKKTESLVDKRTFSVNVDKEIISALDREANRTQTCRSAIVGHILSRALLTRASRNPQESSEISPWKTGPAKIEICIYVPGYAPRTYTAHCPQNEILISLKKIANTLTLEQ